MLVEANQRDILRSVVNARDDNRKGENEALSTIYGCASIIQQHSVPKAFVYAH